MKSKKLSKFIILFLIFSFVFISFLTACQNGDDNAAATTTGGDGNAGQQITDQNDIDQNDTDEIKEIDYFKNIPEGLNFNEAKFNYVTHDGDGWNPYGLNKNKIIKTY